MKIINPIFNGGSQQFADTIINNSQNLKDSDTKLLQLIYENTDSEEERNELINSLETLKSDESEEDEKFKSGRYLRKFLDTGISETSKYLTKSILESTGKWIEYIKDI